MSSIEGFIIELTDNKIQIKHTENFTINECENSILPLLGFTEKSYTGKSEYVSEKQLINTSIYLYIDNISSEPFIIDPYLSSKKQCPMTIQLDNPIESTNELIIKFKKSDNSLYEFNGQPHKLILGIA